MPTPHLRTFLYIAGLTCLTALTIGCTAARPTSIDPSSTAEAVSSQAPTRALPSPEASATPSPTAEAQSTARPPSVTEQPATVLPPSAPAEGESWTSPIDQMELVYVPADEFRMGTLPNYAGGQPDEKPQRLVELEGYWIDKTEVTWAMYSECEAAGGCRPLTQNQPEWADDDHPIVMVSWDDANQYCQWAGRRLPTEAEWEKAARGTDGRRYPWEWIGAPESRGEIRLNYCDASCPYPFNSPGLDDGYSHTAPVGSFPAGASPYGALDMGGNVWEWTADWYQADRYKDEDVDLAQGPEQGNVRVIRGGSWLEPAWEGLVLTSRAANRFWNSPGSSRPDLGFRCAVSAQPTSSD